MSRVEQPVTLAATLTDPAVALPRSIFRARVEHAYRAALYVCRDGSGQRAIVAIADVGGQPGAMLVRDVTDLAALAPRGRKLVVDLSDAVAWSPRIPASARALSHRGFVLAEVDVPGDPFRRAAAPRIDALRLGLVSGDALAAQTAALGLIGLGVGLTPSGDDFLVGMLAGLEATQHPLRAAVATAIARAARGTTAFGAALLEHACRGEFSQRLHDVLIAIAAQEPVALRQATDRAMAYGATSGADTLAGLSLGLDVARSRVAATKAAA
jgi:Protein of unknown function (DUF2877)